MRYFLVVYNRSTGAVEVKGFNEGQREQALEERFARELAERDRPELEIVLLGAESKAMLKRTHSRYFKSAAELAASGL